MNHHRFVAGTLLRLANEVRTEAVLLSGAVRRAEARGCDRLAADLDVQVGRLKRLADMLEAAIRTTA